MGSVAIQSVIRSRAVDVTRTRRVAGLSSTGYGTNADTSVIIKAVIQPMSPKEMRNLPAGQRTLEWRNIWSEAELQNRDIITDPEGNVFTIQSVEFWRETPHYSAKATKAIDDAIS